MRRLLSLALVLALLFVFALPASAHDTTFVYYAGPEGSVRQALTLTGDPDTFVLVDDPKFADVFLLNGAIPDPERIAARVQEGAGLVLILGPDVTASDVGTLLGAAVTLDPRSSRGRDAPLSLTVAPGASDPLVSEILWNSAPQIRERFVLTGGGLTPLAVGFEDGSLILGSGVVGSGRVFVFTPFLDDANPQIQEWAYYNYLIYHVTLRAGGGAPQSFADYPGSPVPHARERTLLLALMALMLATTGAVFVIVRRYSRAHPEALDALVADRGRYEAREAATRWEEIGFHRPLSGFLVALMFGLVLFVPLIIYQNLVLPVYILPSAQALGLWGRVTQFFAFAWQFFDMGTSVAFIKYLSQHRVRDPRRGIQYGQLFVWWQALSGAVQVALVVGLASTLGPRSAYALYAWSVILHTLIQLPGFYQVMRHALNGFQRSDYARFLDLALNALLPMVVQPVFVTLMYAWGRAHPVFGGAMGGLLGLGIAAYAAELATFLVGLWLYRRIGYNARVLFLAHFDWEVVRTGFRFGVFEMLGSIAWAGGQAAEIGITQARLINYAEIWGNWGLAQNFVFSFNVLQTLNDGVMPAMSESISHGRKALSQYYSAQAYKFGGMISAFIGAVLLAVADRFVLGASGPEFARAAAYSLPLVLWGAVQYPSWVGDNVQLAANRPYLKAALVAGEQIIRVALAWLLLERLQINALVVAYFVGLLMKGVVAYFINHRVCFPQRFYFWQSLFAPALAGAVHYLLLRGITGFIWKGDQITSVLIFFIGILPSFPLFAFLYGLLGGWDDDTLAELKSAADLSGVARPLAWLFWAANALGARLSPLHGRWPLDLRAAALAEATSLTEERVRL
jgi:O-antigen/teichoic acid export membrane protein